MATSPSRPKTSPLMLHLPGARAAPTSAQPRAWLT
jgi:hypothetical protein